MNELTIIIIALLIAMFYTNIWQYKSTIRTEGYIKEISNQISTINDGVLKFEKVEIDKLDLNKIF